MGFEKVVIAPKNKDLAAKVVRDRKVKKTPTLKLMTKKEIEDNRVKAYEFAI